MKLENLLDEIRQCTICDLPLGPRPVLAASETAKILIVGQAPGTKVHQSGIPWNDPSGNRLREWLAMDKELFYDESQIAIVPMGFCYPGKGKSGDLPPRKECALSWHEAVMEKMPNLELTLLIGQYAQQYYLGDKRYKNLTETVTHWEEYLPKYIPLPHPSPRNRYWLKNNPWFEEQLVPELKSRVHQILFP
jgi:uracil-DNA glycosylase